ncbi:histidine kinase [Confluentibacter sediminis]|uniref:histidine kinase n=1 Tax=Confluentibacter sediminis TaxID=2219045 RepID=UPI000DAD070E|nr:histidine kinase [Confluentibacter sediminis]
MKKIIFILYFLILKTGLLSAQIVADSIVSYLPLVNQTEVMALSTGNEVSFEDIQKNKNWKPYDSTYTTTPKIAIWLKFKIKNKSKHTLKVYVLNDDNYITIYMQNGTVFKESKNGYLASLSERANKNESYFTEITLSPFHESLCFIKLSSEYQLVNPNYPVIYSRLNYLNATYINTKWEAKSIGFIYFYLVSLFSIFVFAWAFWLRLRQKLYFYYLGYLFFQIVFGLTVLATTTATVGNIFLYFPHISLMLSEPVQFVFIGFYIFFILNLLEIQKYDKTLSKVLYFFGMFCFFYAISRLIFNYYWRDLELGNAIFTTVRLIVLPLNFVLIFWIIYKVKHPLIKYFIVGNSFFFIGSILSSYVAYSNLFLKEGSIFNFPHSPNIIFQASLLIEVLCFSIAIGENIFLLQKEKAQTSKKLIAQLQKNQVLQENMHLELDKKINEKTEELLQLYSQMEKQKEKEIKNSFSQRLKEMEMLALRSQMNPHFVFNSLNSLKNLIMNSYVDDAVTYLDNFSILLRGILQNSSKNVITVEEELEILELYLSLERNRIGESFNYSIILSSKEELSQYTIPPLLLQPFVENAIWHGLNPSRKPEKKLNIIFDTTQNLKITIEDNGIGRQASENIEKLHKSMGTSITKERLSLYNHINDSKMHLNIIDLEENGIPQGTKIILTYNY